MKIGKKSGILHHTTTSLIPRSRKQIYYSSIYTHLIYRHTAWGATIKPGIQPLIKQKQKTNSHYTRTQRYDHTNESSSTLKLLKITDIIV